MKKRLTAVLLSVVMTFSMSGCSALSMFKESTIKSSTGDGTFQITVPSGWIDAKGKLNTSADLEISKAADEMYVMALMETPTSAEKDFSVADYAKVVLDANTTLYLTSMDDMKETKVGSYDALASDFTIDENGEKIHMWLYCLKTENCFGQIVAWTIESKMSSNKDSISKTIQTFKEVTEKSK